MNTKLRYNYALKFTAFLAAFLLTFTGCEEFLKEVPTNELTTAADLSDANYAEAFPIDHEIIIEE